MATSSSSDKKNSVRMERQEIVSGRHVLQSAADTLIELNQGLGKNFIDAIDLLFATKGRVIVSGMGKSGHIGGKIAATLASTGTPAFFVHPSEASHGDLGMIVKNDLVLALSNSGETAELDDIVAHTKRFQIPLITITSNNFSSLRKAATVSLVIPKCSEACPHGLAPTTTTTAMLALGDAIAIAILERKKFSPEDFHLLHPGGKLGSRFLKVSDIMHKAETIPIVNVSAKMSEVIIIITEKQFGCAGVINSAGMLIGIITDGDLRRHMNNDLLEKEAGQIMTASSKTIDPDSLASEGLSLMNINSITNLFVTKGGYPIGILHVHDCLRAGVV